MAIANLVQEHFDKLKIPPGWHVSQVGLDGLMWKHSKNGMSVIASIHKELDDLHWLHLSMAHAKRLPTYDELKYLKRHWAGKERKAVMIFAPEVHHVNLHPNCLHLFCCLDGDPFPDFTWGTGLI